MSETLFLDHCYVTITSFNGSFQELELKEKLEDLDTEARTVDDADYEMSIIQDHLTEAKDILSNISDILEGGIDAYDAEDLRRMLIDIRLELDVIHR